MCRFHCFLFSFLVFLSACSQQKSNDNTDDVKTLNFDISQKDGLNADDLECVFIPLETKEECLLSLSFDDIQFFEERIFIINFHDNKASVFVFSDKGQFIAQIGKIGVGPKEYQQPHKLYINKKKNIITVADRRLNKLINYDLDTYQYISSESVPFNFLNCIWLSDEHILWCDEGGISTGNRKYYYACVTNAEMEIISTWCEIDPSSYSIGHLSLFKHQSQVYIGRSFSPFIYLIDEENMTPVWKLSFGKQKLPPKSLVEDEKENSMAWLKKVMASDYIIAFHAHETDNSLGVSFYGKTFQRHLGFYNKRTQETHAYTAQNFMKRFHLYGVYDIINTYDDYFVARIEPRLLKKYSPQREDLRRIAENMTEEDNPILCLFKFK
jgi:hypothetical protein